MERVATLKFLFGLSLGGSGTDDISGDNINYVHELTSLLASKISDLEYLAASDMGKTLYKVQKIPLS